MFYRIKSEMRRRHFNVATRSILDTPPLKVAPGPIVVLSMLRSADLQMYLIVVKAFYSRLGRGEVVVIADRDLTAADRELLREHVPDIRLVEIDDIDVGTCQRGGTWERLIFALDCSRDSYVVQLDSDVLPFGNMDEIVGFVAENCAFALGSDWARLSSMAEAADSAAQRTDNHMVTAAHRAFAEFPDAAHLRYVLDGSSGLSGYARGGIGRDRIEQFHDIMQARLGERWHEWGSEQVASNFAVANAPEAAVLPWPKYAVHWPWLDLSGAECLHFIGSHRFEGGLFASKAHRVISELRSCWVSGRSPA